MEENKYENILIQKMIVHEVNHRQSIKPRLSDLESPISDEVEGFLRRHLGSSREHKNIRNACFSNVERPISDKTSPQIMIAEHCYALMHDPDQFVSRSRIIAEHLFETMQGDKRISPGDLVICTFIDNNKVDDGIWLALLKMDPQEGVVTERIQKNGQVQTILTRVPDVLPTGELQKCAYILPDGLRESKKYDLQVLDQQAARYGVRRVAASFFTEAFLQCEIELNRSDKTRLFVYTAEDWVERKKDNWPEPDINRFMERITDTIQDELVDITSFAQSVIPDIDEQDEYLEYMKNQGLEELTFRPDPGVRKQLTDFVWFEGDAGLKIRIHADAVGPGKILDPGNGRNPGTNEWTITIRTTTWNPKIRGAR